MTAIEGLWHAPFGEVSVGSLLLNEHFALFYDLDLFSSLLSTVRGAFPSHFRHALAMKANPLRHLLALAVERGFGLEVASLPELSQASTLLGQDPRSIVFDSPAKTSEEIERALKLGATLNIDNLQELERVAHIVERIPSTSCA